jgi:hypothetical protein
MLKRGVGKENLTYLDQEKEISGIWISLRKCECEVKGCGRLLDKLFSAEGDTLGNITCQRGTYGKGLYHDRS